MYLGPFGGKEIGELLTFVKVYIKQLKILSSIFLELGKNVYWGWSNIFIIFCGLDRFSIGCD